MRWLLLVQRRSPQTGFTLIELLVAMVVGSIIVGTLLYGAVELLQINQREDSRTETQRDMQAALDYMAAEIREAVFVYDGKCLDASANDGKTLVGGCSKLEDHLPLPVKTTTDTIPVLALWRVDELPQKLIKDCAANAAQLNATNLPAAISGIPCLSRRTFSLVVYYLDKTPSTTWRGNARIRRYELTQFDSDGKFNKGWVDPTLTANGFVGWPLDTKGENIQPKDLLPDQSTNLAKGLPDTPTNIPVLVDFVDDPASGQTTGCPATDGTNVPPFVRTPTTGSNSFYACVRGGGIQISTESTTGANNEVIQTFGASSNNPGARNQEVALFIRGNAAGRGGVPKTARVTFEMSTQALTRGSYAKTPAAE